VRRKVLVVKQNPRVKKGARIDPAEPATVASGSLVPETERERVKWYWRSGKLTSSASDGTVMVEVYGTDQKPGEQSREWIRALLEIPQTPEADQPFLRRREVLRRLRDLVAEELATVETICLAIP
jgi:hypothetical protein